MKSPNKAAAFSLVELLVVVAILAVLAGAATVSMRVVGGRGPQSAAVVASSVFNLARTEAIMRSTDTLVIIDTTPTSTNYLRRMSVVLDGTNNKQIASWTTLPATACFNQNLSTPSVSSTTFSTLPGSYAVYSFKSNGQSYNPAGAAKFVVSQGSIVGGNFQETATGRRYGFLIHKIGKLTFFNDPSEIQ